jgi:hypothetical protein
MPCTLLQSHTSKTLKSFNTEWSTMLVRELQTNVVGLSTLFGGSLMEHYGRLVDPLISKSCCTVGTNGLMGSSSSPSLLNGLLFACVFGSINGNRHGSYILARLELIPKLQVLMPFQNEQYVADGAGNETVYSLYGDPAYPQSLYAVGGYRNPPPCSDQACWYTEMSKVCKVVDWGFANLISNWALLDFKASMMIFQRPVAKYYIVAAFLRKLRTCFYANRVWITSTAMR